MRIVMRDGRMFHGTALQIVKAMQDIATEYRAVEDGVGSDSDSEPQKRSG